MIHDLFLLGITSIIHSVACRLIINQFLLDITWALCPNIQLRSFSFSQLTTTATREQNSEHPTNPTSPTASFERPRHLKHVVYLVAFQRVASFEAARVAVLVGARGSL